MPKVKVQIKSKWQILKDMDEWENEISDFGFGHSF